MTYMCTTDLMLELHINLLLICKLQPWVCIRSFEKKIRHVTSFGCTLEYTNVSYANVIFMLIWISEFDNINTTVMNFVCFSPYIVSRSRLV